MSKLIALGLLAATVYGTFTLASKPAYPQTCYNYGGIWQCQQQPQGSVSNGFSSGVGALQGLQNREYLYERTREQEMRNRMLELQIREMCTLPHHRDTKVCKEYQ